MLKNVLGKKLAGICCIMAMLTSATVGAESVKFQSTAQESILKSAEFNDSGLNEFGWGMNADSNTIENGVLKLFAGQDGEGYKNPGFVTSVGEGLYTSDVKNIQMRVRVAADSNIKFYYESNEHGFSEGDDKGDKTVVSDETVVADGEWHTVTLTPASGAWVNNTNRVIKKFWFLATSRMATFEIDWIRLMGAADSVAADDPGYEVIGGLEYNDPSINEYGWCMCGSGSVGNGYLNVSTGSGNPGYVTGKTIDLVTDDVKKIQMRVRAAADSRFKIYYQSNETPDFSEGDETGDRTIVTQTVPADGAWHVITVTPTSGAWVNNKNRVLGVLWVSAIDAPSSFDVDWIRFMDAKKISVSELGALAALEFNDASRSEFGWGMECASTSVAGGTANMVSGGGNPGFVTGKSIGLCTSDVKSIKMRVRVETDSYIKAYYQSNETGEFGEGDGLGDKTVITSEKVPGDGAWHIVTITPTSAAWVNGTNRVLGRLWFRATDSPSTFYIDWIRFMGNIDGAEDVATDASINVATDNADIDFTSLAALGSGAVTVNGGKAAVEDISYSEADDKCSYNFTLKGLRNLTEYSVTAKVPAKSGTVAEKTFKFTTGANYDVLDSMEYEGYSWDHYAGDESTSDFSPALASGKNEVGWSMNCKRTYVENGVLKMESNGQQPGTVTSFLNGVHTSDIKNIQLRVRVSKDSYIKLYYQSNEDHNFGEGDGVGDKTIVSKAAVPADGNWHIVTLTPTSNRWVNNTSRTLEQLWIQASESPDLYEIDWVRFMKNYDVITTAQKYEIGSPVISRGETGCTVKMPAIVNYSSDSIKLAYIISSYENGKLTGVECVNKTAAAGKAVASFDAELSAAAQGAEVKTFIWNIDTLNPISETEAYTDVVID